MLGAESYVTDTSHWTLAVHRVSCTTAEIWVGTLFPAMAMPTLARVDLKSADGHCASVEITREQWQRPFRKLGQRFFHVVRFDALQPGTRYEVRFFRRLEGIPGIRPTSWQDLRSGIFDTLPEALPSSGAKPFVVGLGSCFFNHRDGGQAAGSYKALYERGPVKFRPDVTFLTGDQVYLDIGFDSLSLVPAEIRQRIANDYAEHWRALGSILNRGATWLLPDDHEYWNDYPFHDSLIPTLLALNLENVRRAWDETARDGVLNVERAVAVETFALGEDLSFCLADLRSHRSARGFTRADALGRICHWAETLDSPGVLVIPQPLLTDPGMSERNLANFPEQYRQLLASLAHSGHDILVLSGDVHYGRIATVPLGEHGARLVEVVSSPLSNLTGLHGIASAVADAHPLRFPPKEIGVVPGVPQARVSYDRRFRVSSRPGRWLSAYPRARTSEHFMTVGFSRLPDGAVEVEVQAWRVRQRSPRGNLPVRDFPRPFRCRLR